jgi:hypothetical protein
MQILRKSLLTIGLTAGYIAKGINTAKQYLNAGYLQGKE